HGAGRRRLPLLLQPALQPAHRGARLPLLLLVQGSERPDPAGLGNAAQLPGADRHLRRRPLDPLLSPPMTTRILLLLCCFSLAAAAQQVGLPDPDVMKIHVLEKRPFTEAGRWEVSFFGAAQVNPKFTVHAGFSGELAYHLRENLALQIG